MGHGLLQPGSALEGALVDYLPSQRWFRSKLQTLSAVQLLEALPLSGPFFLAFVNVSLAGGEAELYVLPLELASGALRPEGALIGRAGHWLVDASHAPAGCAALQAFCLEQREQRGERFVLRAQAEAVTPGLPIRPLRGEQSNTSFVCGQSYVGKLARKIELGNRVEVDVLQALNATEVSANVPRLLGQVELEFAAETTTLLTLQSYVPNDGNAWELALEHARHPDGADAFGPLASKLGLRTAELHAALLAAFRTGEHAARPCTSESNAAFHHSLQALGAAAWAAIQDAALPAEAAELSAQLLGRWAEIEERLERALAAPPAGKIMRIHGDYHLGQVLWTGARAGADFVIIDFEGEPARSLRERTALRSPLADVAGMLRSLHYAGFTAQHGAWQRAQSFYEIAARHFFDGYVARVERLGILPDTDSALSAALELHLLEKALYELVYELNNRPTWAELPLRGILGLLQGRARP
jgi:maltose alpha-D-glucosyltransferase / alpha-amylase